MNEKVNIGRQKLQPAGAPSLTGWFSAASLLFFLLSFFLSFAGALGAAAGMWRPSRLRSCSPSVLSTHAALRPLHSQATSNECFTGFRLQRKKNKHISSHTHTHTPFRGGGAGAGGGGYVRASGISQIQPPEHQPVITRH